MYMGTEEGRVIVYDGDSVSGVEDKTNELIPDELDKQDPIGGNYPSSDGMLFISRVVSALVYVSFSVVLLVYLMTGDYCPIKTTYRQEFLSGFSSNPFYSSTQIIRNPPFSNVEMGDVGSDFLDLHRVSDVGAFPVVLKRPVADAAFWPVLRDSDPSINSLFNSIPMGGIQAMIDAMYGKNETNSTMVVMDLVGALTMASIIANMRNLSSPSLLTPMQRIHGASYHLLDNGMVMTPDIGMPLETSGLFTSMMSQSHHGLDPTKGSNGGVLPNIARCIGELKPVGTQSEEQAKASEKAWLLRLAQMASNSQRRGTCLLTGLQDVVDVSSNHMTSVTIFSSINILFMALLCSWIGAGFSIFFLGGIDTGIATTTSRSLMAFVVVWNLLLSTMSILFRVLFPVHALWIPLNNIALSIVIPLVAVGVQLTIQGKKNDCRGKDKDNEDDTEGGVNTEGGNSQNDPNGKEDVKSTLNDPRNGISGGSSLLRRSILSVDLGHIFTNGRPVQRHRKSHAQQKGHHHHHVHWNRRRYNRLGTEMGEGLPDGVQEHDSGMVAECDKNSDATVCMEYALVNPIIVCAVLIGSSWSVPTGVVQLAYLCSLLFHILCIPALGLSAVVGCFRPTNGVEDAKGLLVYNQALHGAILSLVGCMIALLSSMYLFFSYSTGDHSAATHSSFIPSVAIVGALQICYGLGVCGSFVLNCTSRGGHHSVFMSIYTLIALALRLSFFIIVIVSISDDTLYSCNIWARTGSPFY